MKVIHISDLHLGKKPNEFSFIEDQEHILGEILNIVRDERPGAVIIAGDIYDKPVPPTEAVSLLDSFLVSLAEKNITVLAISGNHDSTERLSFGARLMYNSGVYFSQVYNGSCKPVKLEDEYGKINFYMLPFVRPANVREFFPDDEIESYDDAVRKTVGAMDIDTDERNVIIVHQYVTGAERSDSEKAPIGTLDNIDGHIFDDFDYVALGHIHKPQSVGRAEARYCGAPLKYSFSESNYEKSVTVVEFAEKGSVTIRTLPLVPLHDMREIKGSYMEVTAQSAYNEKKRMDYLHVTLTDENEIPEAYARLRTIYPNIMKLDYENRRTKAVEATVTADTDRKSPVEIFDEFYEKRNNVPMSEEQKKYMLGIISEIWENND